MYGLVQLLFDFHSTPILSYPYHSIHLSLFDYFAVENEEGNGCDLLLTKEFLENCVQYFSIPTRATDTGDQFPVKHINIMDPLKSNNNLGRSVNRGI